MSGLLAAVRLQEAGMAFKIVEKHPDVGGTWLQNVYPGCRVDSANHMYSYTFKPKDWPQHFSEQEVLRQYFAETAEEYDLRKNIQFNSEVTEMTWQEATGLWRIDVRDEEGNTDTLTANAVISAVGQLNRPKWPELPGRDKFQGPSFHSTQWNYQHDLKGKRVAVIGTGASSFQFVPRIAQDAERVSIFQRTAPWLAPVPEYMQDIAEGKHWLLNNVPFYHQWYRFAIFWRSAEGMLQATEKDAAWKGDEQVSISAANDMLREMFLGYITEIVGDDQELLAKCTPDYPVGGKRILLDDGTWLRTLKRDNVHVHTDSIVEINETGLLTNSGEQYDVDVIIYGTGFHASRFLWPMKVVGRDGLVLEEHWDGDPRAYLGITIPGFPNLFCCYGPNTNIVVNGSIIFFSECEVRYIMGCLEILIENGARYLDCRSDVHDAFNKKVDEANGRMAWGISDANTWYRNDAGRVTQNWPFTLLDYWQRTRLPDPADFEIV
jgi:4-hydroxyacetophenone monooxygenase